MYGEDVGKTVLVKSLNYESGLATVKTVPNRVETTIPIACLNEIDLHVSDVGDFGIASDTYFDFLCTLADAADDSFEDGMNAKIIAIHMKYIDLMRNINPKLFDGPHPQIDYAETKSRYVRYVEFEDSLYATINFDSHGSISCQCNHDLNEVHYKTLCKHLVAAINKLCISEMSDWYQINKNIEMFTRKLKILQEKNLSRMIFAIYEVLGDNERSLFKEYLSKYTDSDTLD